MKAPVLLAYGSVCALAATGCGAALTADAPIASEEQQSPVADVAFTKKVIVLGVPIYATNTTGDDKLLHAAGVLAQFLDNDEDGAPDNP